MEPSRRAVLTGALAVAPAVLLTAGPAHAAAAAVGRPVVQDVQRQLATRYGARPGFPSVNTDGRWTGDTQRALIHALQLEVGLAETVANGSFGPLTRAKLKELPDLVEGSVDTTGFLGHLLQAALVAMTTWDGPVDGRFSSAQAARLRAFQDSVGLARTGRGDFATWSSLLASNGDPTRPGTAADGIAVITLARARVLRDAGYEVVGRYLTDSDRPDALAKRIQDGELESILAGGLRVFPIFQEGGTDTTYFSYDLGVRAAARADDAARRLGFLPGTTIYFAVDFDATPDQVERLVQPHFRGIRAELARRGSAYAVGVYGGRQVCTTLSAAHLADLSFVAGMSTGWLSNLGVRMPGNWAFDQVQELSMGPGETGFDIDKGIVSGRDPGQSRIQPTT
ncbi:glycoside hydrolase domain-containing protein [Clavibacter sp. MX14-G9D]|uniref:glycoside hydrolase domain-containing protein n=1 Tax=Clavibacter sp. MX14-G9D TaxID=3064656 RepID=UPI00293ECC5A|nr:glycoside hydrolase domain-containing protein [Clavibacter sp. MX14-G9D]